LWRTENERRGGRGLREHRRPDHEARETRVGPGVGGEASGPDAGEEGIVHDLDEPDDTYHDEGRREVDEEHQFQRDQISLPRRRSAAARPESAAPSTFACPKASPQNKSGGLAEVMRQDSG
jgi:hypothetical protein